MLPIIVDLVFIDHTLTVKSLYLAAVCTTSIIINKLRYSVTTHIILNHSLLKMTHKIMYELQIAHSHVFLNII